MFRLKIEELKNTFILETTFYLLLYILQKILFQILIQT